MFNLEATEPRPDSKKSGSGVSFSFSVSFSFEDGSSAMRDGAEPVLSVSLVFSAAAFASGGVASFFY
jgi:hypothetical protein